MAENHHYGRDPSGSLELSVGRMVDSDVSPPPLPDTPTPAGKVIAALPAVE